MISFDRVVIDCACDRKRWCSLEASRFILFDAKNSGSSGVIGWRSDIDDEAPREEIFSLGVCLVVFVNEDVGEGSRCVSDISAFPKGVQ